MVLYDNPKRFCEADFTSLKGASVYLGDIRGFVHFEDLYCARLNRVNLALVEKHPAVISRRGVILLRDSAKTHCAKRTMEKINESG